MHILEPVKNKLNGSVALHVSKTEAIKYVQDQRLANFKKYGIACFDIESYTDNNSAFHYGNTHPFMLSFYGKMYSHKLGDFVKEDKVFKGFDCCLQFVKHLLSEGYFYNPQNNVTEGAKDFVCNYIFAHNGCNFDFKFILQYLIQYKEFTDCQIVGNPQNMKAIICSKLMFYDSFLVLSKSLRSIANSFKDAFPPNVKDMIVKLDSSVILNIDFDKAKNILQN